MLIRKRLDSHRAETESNGQAAKGTATERRSTDKHRNGKEKRRSERQWKGNVRNRIATKGAATEQQCKDTLRNGTESLRQDPKRNRRALTGNETEKQKYRAGRNPAERKIIWQSLKLEIELY
nr:MAG TPA: hypothetical protein [Caudoviricetes sp.]